MVCCLLSYKLLYEAVTDSKPAVNVRQYSYKGLVFDTMPVTQHICSIMVFVALFTHLYESELVYTIRKPFC